MIENVESFGAELQAVRFRVGHLEVLQHRKIEVPEARSGSDVAAARATGDGESERALGVVDIRKILNGWGHARLTGRNLVNSARDVRLVSDEDPRLSLGEVNRKCSGIDLEWISTVGRSDTGEFPAADEQIDPFRRVVKKSLARADRKLVFKGADQDVALIEIGTAPTYAQVAQIANLGGIEIDQGVLNPGVIVDGVRVSVICLHRQVVGQAMVHLQDQAVVIRGAEVADEGGGSVLRQQTDVRQKQTLLQRSGYIVVVRQSLNHG